ncbi:MAG: hypothetical protein A2W61_00595 [Deltaproteobacteria bacterium RIFCSPLOWO2_01_44_7]|nr:MAG: hypothetical protein A2712_08850 [Deltaproteobacteria bacterium RIFCSPHIGHO2_01_FULL_43_49]OGQ14555.1 MAG: hypothetical protein A3D22_08150 [Deltaproteobacteria bacterium RIFCSPHIGHO2_02_FULL_44_53]OGQ27941.1 MAG: hypothetical protein A3D98_06860 [Deltaproteobacteria bacterium RIFCSPHIGHO2_12_FULL_44_21]OGQ31153.1 MAG: hypothetical protein A2979_06910 [Deltaproteobacteria bacterium RIFCSPLOWO2_01_FULL_45_74]OGQ37575.1 MAG: hypothetical protein A2W61_00595 [Deltaproteobacteria bacterium 
MRSFERNDKRLALRRKWRSKIVFEDEFGEGLIYLYSKDISLGGLFLEEPPPLKLGASLFLSFILPGRKRPIKVTGQVVRFVEHEVESNQSLKKGAGVRFLDLDPKTYQLLSEFVKEN